MRLDGRPDNKLSRKFVGTVELVQQFVDIDLIAVDGNAERLGLCSAKTRKLFVN